MTDRDLCDLDRQRQRFVTMRPSKGPSPHSVSSGTPSMSHHCTPPNFCSQAPVDTQDLARAEHARGIKRLVRGPIDAHANPSKQARPAPAVVAHSSKHAKHWSTVSCANTTLQHRLATAPLLLLQGSRALQLAPPLRPSWFSPGNDPGRR